MNTPKRRGSACTEGEPLRNKVLPDPNHTPEASDEDMLRCDIWVTCENPYCFQSGCLRNLVRNAKNQHKRGKSS